MIIEQPSHKFILLWQVLLQLVATILLSLIFGWYREWALSALVATMLGGVIATSAGLYFGWRSFRYSAGKVGEASPHRMLADFYQAMVMKVLMVAVLLALAFRYGDELDKLGLLLGFVLISLFGVACTAVLLRPNPQLEKY